jgi:hypothetical protein
MTKESSGGFDCSLWHQRLDGSTLNLDFDTAGDFDSHE